MTAPVLAPPVIDRTFDAWHAEAPRRDAGGTLDDAIVGLWTVISAHRAAACPLCQGEMRPEYGAGALPVAGRCQDCGSALT